MENTRPTAMPVKGTDERTPGTPIGIARSRDAFLRDLPVLLANPKWDRWCVAYCGDERIALAETQEEVLRECQRRGLHPDQVHIGCIFPHSNEEEEVDFGFCEFDEIDPAHDEPVNRKT